MAITDEALWQMEERLWTAPVADCEDDIGDDCLMVLPQEGVMTRDFAVAAMRGAPRWDAVDIGERHVARAGKDVAVLGYRATGTRTGSPEYLAYCSSTYRGADDGWKLVQHQQTKAA